MSTSRPSTVEQCRRNGWGPGTRLVGDEGYGPTVIEITAVGELTILAKTISHNDHEYARQWETNWTLELRDWTEVARMTGERDAVEVLAQAWPELVPDEFVAWDPECGPAWEYRRDVAAEVVETLRNAGFTITREDQS